MRISTVAVAPLVRPKKTHNIYRLAAGVALATATSGSAYASCGAAFCAVNTDWSVQGLWTEPGVRADVRFEYIDQDQPRAGTRRVAVGEIPAHHDEVRTISRNLILGLDANLNEHWGLAASVPLMHRSHEHIHHHHGSEHLETWDFRRMGDVTLLGRYQNAPAFGSSVYGLRLGVKLPTGETDVSDDGRTAERSLQPGTGTTDGIIGAYYHRSLLRSPATWFAQIRYQRAFNEYRDYRPGYEVSVDLGGSYPLGERWRALLQVNALERGQDAGAEAEPEDTGGRFVHVSPGAAYSPTASLQLYGMVQLPLYQDVEGVQLTADWAAVAGISYRF